MIFSSSINLTETPFAAFENAFIPKFVLLYLNFETGTFKKARLTDLISFRVI